MDAPGQLHQMRVLIFQLAVGAGLQCSVAELVDLQFQVAAVVLPLLKGIKCFQLQEKFVDEKRSHSRQPWVCRLVQRG